MDNYITFKDGERQIAVIYSSSGRWYTKYNDKELLYYPPLVRYIINKKNKLEDLVYLEGPYDWRLTELGEDIFKKLPKNIRVPIRSIYALKIKWIPKKTLFRVRYSESGEIVETVDDISWFIA